MDRPAVSSVIVMGPETDATIVWLRGEHDIASIGEVSEAVARAMAFDNADLVIDLSEVSFLSAATVGILMGARESLRQESRSLTLRAPSAAAWRIVEVCGLTSAVAEPPAADAARALGTWVDVRGSAVRASKDAELREPDLDLAGQDGR